MAWALIFVINRISFGWTLQFAFEPHIYLNALMTAIVAVAGRDCPGLADCAGCTGVGFT
jgi:hypothetical protein